MSNNSDNKLDAIMKELQEYFKETMPSECVAVRMCFTSQGYEFDYETRTAESLQRDGISMRNLKGIFISQ